MLFVLPLLLCAAGVSADLPSKDQEVNAGGVTICANGCAHGETFYQEDGPTCHIDEAVPHPKFGRYGMWICGDRKTGTFTKRRNVPQCAAYHGSDNCPAYKVVNENSNAKVCSRVDRFRVQQFGRQEMNGSRREP
ncbi:uncharacterized protein MAM_01310 [Metarhizium album ARSEF 1941]|uniref:Uncharacterized protein n=1 Tax=Metarhizium album (strain ARSEF 1941) TaxID=1081103 RepID=A0A0B2WWE2_METAS|nr:uncharacterized protein MAM_01310 [Metarhizium album ARSEF 1941]KHO00532.1 hypothetical protein MAM_01310 [Metarhizium album ARSEF 1941]